MPKSPSNTVVRELLPTAHAGAGLLNDAALETLRTFILNQQLANGSFAGPGGQPDVYFTTFGLACAQAVGLPLDRAAVGRFLDECSEQAGHDLVHLSCLIQCWALLSAFGPMSLLKRRRLARNICRFRAEDGGFANVPGASSGTAYGAYMAFLGYSAAGSSLSDMSKAGMALLKLRTSEGGFLNEEYGAGPTIPATVAAVVVLRATGEDVPSSCVSWIRGQCHNGFYTSPLTPLPDLLSTAVATFALTSCDETLDDTAREACAAFIDDQWHPEGGFCATVLDEEPDIEYTFYGLLALGSLSRLMPGPGV